MSLLGQKLLRAFSLSKDLLFHLDQSALDLHLKDLPSNSIGQQYWCIVGARESYLKAVEAGQWSGFSCSLTDTRDKVSVIEKLDQTRLLLEELLKRDLGDHQLNLLHDLLEHEIQHHGQLIRYVYGNKLSFPESWNKRYTV